MEVIQTYPINYLTGRIFLDIIFGADGDLSRFEYLVNIAKRDWRDLIMATEYEKVDGKIVRRKNLRKA